MGTSLSLTVEVRERSLPSLLMSFSIDVDALIKAAVKRLEINESAAIVVCSVLTKAMA